MKRNKLILAFLLFLIFLVAIGATNCKKSSSRNDEALVGNWISTDIVDTLEFTSNHDLFKMINGVRDHYSYKLSADSILITYEGIQLPYIYLGPSKMRFYELNGNSLIIDFTNSYYGFRSQIVKLNKR